MKINYELREDEIATGATPIKVADALISNQLFSMDEIEEIADHLRAYTRRVRWEERRRNYTIPCSGGERCPDDDDGE